MKLQDRLPDGVTVDGRFYKMDFDFRNVLRMIEILDRDDLMPEAKAYNALHCLCKRPRNAVKVCEAVKGLLFTASRKKAHKTDQTRVTDFVQDAGMIRAAFLQVFGIDLYRDKVHWIKFTELLSAIPEGNRYSEVLGIRSRSLPEPTKWNQKEREWLIKAKHDVALDLTEEEQAAQYQRDVNNIADVLMAMAEGSET